MKIRSSVVCAALGVVLATGCSEEFSTIYLGPENLEKGTTLLFMIDETDSVITQNSMERRKHLQKAVHFTVLDTVDGFTIEWNEQHFLERLDSSNVNGPVQEWVPYCKMVYHCDRMGTIDKVLNYDEIRSTIDPLVEHYLQMVGMAEDPRVEKVLPALMDSSWVISRLLTNTELLHRLYGFTVSMNDTIHLRSYTPHTTPETAEYSVTMGTSPLCKNAVGIASWSDPISVELKDVLTTTFNDIAEVRDLTIQSATSTEHMNACFDPKRGIVTYLNFERRMQVDTLTLVQRIILYENE